MSENVAGQTDQSRARKVFLAQLAAPLRDFLTTESGSAGILLGATVLALVWANSPWSESYFGLWSTELSLDLGGRWSLEMDLAHWVNDGLMALFFFVVGLEVRRELSVGELTDRSRLIVPTIAAAGGLVLPAVLYLLVNPSGEAMNGWGVVIGTDTAFLLGALALVGPAFPAQLRVFLLTLTIVDDVMAIAVIGLVYSERIDPWMLALAAACVGVLVLFGRRGVWRTSLYVLVGAVLWLATVASGLHPTIAGMAAGLAIGATRPQRAAVERAASRFRAFRQSPLPVVGSSAVRGLQRAVSANERFQVALHPWTSFLIVPVFALANAGVDLRGGVLGDALRSPVTWGVVLGLVVGKLVGISVGGLGTARLGLGALPQGVGPGQVVGGAALSGIGFTVSLLIAGLAFSAPALRAEATVGVLISAALAMALGSLIFWLAAVLHGERTASLPMVLDRPVDPARDHILGRVDAPLTLVEYADFECPFCGKATGVVRELIERFGDDLRYVFRHLPLSDVHPHAEESARAAEAAGAQGRFWEMHGLLFRHQEQLTFEDLVGYAGELGLNVEDFVRDMEEERHAERIREDVASAEASGARGTPTFFIGERRHIGPYDTETLAAELEASRHRSGGAAALSG